MLKYLIHELAPEGNKFHGEKNTKTEAESAVGLMRQKSKNAFIITPKYVPVKKNIDQIPAQIVTADQLYRHNYGDEKKLSEQPYSTRIIYDALAKSATKILRGQAQ